ncbi:MAG: pilus assembly protein [Chloroflexi bacterium]|nr:pilus assembly protein [Chloroflexota bacterium]
MFPVILLLLAGITEVGFIFFAYLTVLDQTREAARFASVRDYNAGADSGVADPLTTCTDAQLDFYYDTACFFIDPALNPYSTFREDDFDDVAISVFTIADNEVTDRYPMDGDGVWSLYSDNWKKDCNGDVVNSDPFLGEEAIEALFVADAPDDRGLVLIEGYYCYDLLLNLPIISQIVPSPFRIHAYTIMPAPEAIPTPTPIGAP